MQTPSPLPQPRPCSSSYQGHCSGLPSCTMLAKIFMPGSAVFGAVSIWPCHGYQAESCSGTDPSGVVVALQQLQNMQSSEVLLAGRRQWRRQQLWCCISGACLCQLAPGLPLSPTCLHLQLHSTRQPRLQSCLALTLLAAPRSSSSSSQDRRLALLRLPLLPGWPARRPPLELLWPLGRADPCSRMCFSAAGHPEGELACCMRWSCSGKSCK